MLSETARLLVAGCILTGLGQKPACGADHLMWHEVRLDEQGKLISWVQTGEPYGQIIRNAWEAFKNIPAQPDGFRTYFTHPTFYGPNDPNHAPFSGRPWVHHPAGLFAMLTDSAILYHAYSGDRAVLDRVREMLDRMIAHGSTEATDAWALVPYTCANAGQAVYRGADDTIYCYQENHTPCGRGDGVGFLEPDKVGELGYAYLLFYEVTLEDKYLLAALRCADALAKHVRPGDESHSPWPFRVDAKTGTRIREEYCANTIGPIRLLDELLRIKKGNIKEYRRARELAWKWLMTYPVRNRVWTQYFEDVLTYPDYRINLNQYSPLETARYFLLHPEFDPECRAKAKEILDWVTAFFAADSVTMGGISEKGLQWGAEVISEQVNDMDKMSSHTARYAFLRALWYELTGEQDSKERAFRSFNWATYSSRTNGLVKTSLDEGTGYWFSDGYGDYMRHFQRGMASVPEWAPAGEDHLLGSSSVVRSIRYTDKEITYSTYDAHSREVLRLRHEPKRVDAGNAALKRLQRLADKDQGYSVDPAPGSGFVVRIQHNKARNISVQIAAPAESGKAPADAEPVRRPRISGKWRQIAGNPDLGELSGPNQQPVDFAVWRAADGAWQLWSCIRHTKEPGNTRLFYRWEGRDLTEPNWKPIGIAMQADTGFGETTGGLQAPFVFRDGSRYIMFYGGWDSICSAAGTDGKTFERQLDPQGKASLFDEGDGNARDPMVIKIRRQWHCYYTAHPKQKGATYCRTSSDLRQWSAPRIVAVGGQAGTGPFSAECPFVAELERGHFYLFRTQRYGENAQTSVYHSFDPLDFGVDNDSGHFVCTLPIAAPELIRNGDRWFIAALLPNLKGIQAAELSWE